MKKLLLLSMLLTISVFLNSCKKDKDDDLQSTSVNSDQMGSSEIGASERDKNWTSPSNTQLNTIWNHMMSGDIDYVDAVNFIYLNGTFDWNEARLVKQVDNNNYLVSIPTIVEGRVVSVLFAAVVNNNVSYFQVDLPFMQKTLKEIVETLGIEKTMLAITTFAAHEQHFNDYISVCLIEHLHSDIIQDAMHSVTPRGLCLIEVIIWVPYSGQAYTSNTTGWSTTDGTLYRPQSAGGLHGSNHGSYQLFHFWAWCPDEQNQWGNDDWLNTDGDENNGGNGTVNNAPNWEYNGDGWFEGNEDCMFSFGGMAENQFNNLESELSGEVCGEAAQYAIESVMASVINNACSENNDSDGFPTEIISVEETIDEIRDRLSNNPQFSVGDFICDFCDEAPGSPGACIAEFDNCGTVDYEECIAEIIGERIDELLLDNPALLLEIDCDRIENWQTLAQHTAPQSVLDKVEGLPSDFFNSFEIQSLEHATGTHVNLDYFGVNVSNFPNHPTTGQQFTANSFLDYFRRNINDFFDDSVLGSEFGPFCEPLNPSICTQETDLWNSNNPLGSVIYIDIPGDDGVVICSEYSNNYWNFMTMNAPIAGNHPVSGTRQFGYELNPDGSYNFFVRGVDRFGSNTIENLAIIGTLGNPFLGADTLWESFQTKMTAFITNNGGSSTGIVTVKNRPDWDKVAEVLRGERPISDLGCD